MKQVIKKLFKELESQEYTYVSSMELYVFCENFFPEVIAMNLPDSFYSDMTDFFNKNI